MDRIRVLILEDDDAMREMLAGVVESQGYEVVAVGRGEDAVHKATQESFDVIVCDIRMDGMDGLTALEQVKQQQPDIGSLVVTGYSTEADSIRAIRLGVGDYLKKPFRLPNFLESVEGILARRHQEQKNVRRRQAATRMVDWALDTVAGMADRFMPPDELPSGGLARIGDLAASVMAGFQVPPDQVDAVRITALLSGLNHWGVALDCPEDTLPVDVRQLLHHVAERWDGAGEPQGLHGEAIPLGSRVVAAVIASLHEPRGPGLAQRLDAQHPGAFDPQVLSALESAPEKLAARSHETEQAGHRRRGLLSLGRTLEQGGQRSSAAAAYQNVLMDGATSREAVEALLGLARLARREGDAEGAASRASEALDQARRLGPALAGPVALQASVLLSLLGHPQGRPLAEEAARLLREFRNPWGFALAQIARVCFHGAPEPLDAPLQALLAPEFTGHLAEQGDWLIPFLLERQGATPSPTAARLLHRLARECSRRFARAVSGSLTPQAKLVAIEATAGCGELAEPVLRRLATDFDQQVRLAAEQALHIPGEARPPLLRILSLGGFEVFRGEDRVAEKDWKSQKVRYLLARLASHRDRPVTEDELLETFWPGDPEKGRKNLYAATSYLRRHLRPEGWKGDLDYVVRTPVGLALNSELPRWHDLDEMDEALAEAERHQAAGHAELMVDSLRRAARIYRGPYLDGCYMDWALAIRTRVERQMVEALHKLAQTTYKLGRFQETLEYTGQVLEVDPCFQEAHLLRMHGFLAAGRPEQAVRQFEQCRDVLDKELGMEPSINLLEAHQRALLSID